MVNHACEMCNKKILFDNLNCKIYNKHTHFILCLKCKKYYLLTSKTQACKQYVLKESNLHNLKYLYIKNVNNKIKLYKTKDIKQTAIAKHGGLSNIHDKQDIQNSKKRSKKLKKKKETRIRKKRLLDVFKLNKLCVKNYGDCYSYIHYGTPSLEKVIEKEFETQNELQNRRIKLANELKSLNIIFDEGNKLCCDYIYNIGWMNFYETVRAIEMENYIKNKNSIRKTPTNNIKIDFS